MFWSFDAQSAFSIHHTFYFIWYVLMNILLLTTYKYQCSTLIYTYYTYSVNFENYSVNWWITDFSPPFQKKFLQNEKYLFTLRRHQSMKGGKRPRVVCRHRAECPLSVSKCTVDLGAPLTTRQPSSCHSFLDHKFFQFVLRTVAIVFEDQNCRAIVHHRQV